MRLPEIQDELNGLPRRPVALRLAPLVTQLEVEDILTWLSETAYLGSPVYLLHAHQYEPDGRHRAGTPQLYGSLLDAALETKGLRRKLQLLPADHFVWSDELARAFTSYIDLFIGRDEAVATGMGLKWDVAITPFAGLLGECPDFDGKGTSRRTGGKMKTAARHADWQRRVEEKARQFPKRNHSDVCRLVARDLQATGGPRAPSWKTIRRIAKLPLT